MIFVTTGTQLPFPRLVNYVFELFHDSNENVVLQTLGDYENDSDNIKIVEKLLPKDYFECVNKSQLVIGHAGTGTILAAITSQKPIIVVPRKYELLEHRNDHQCSTVIKYGQLNGIYRADNKDELRSLITAKNNLDGPNNRRSVNKRDLIKNIKLLLK